MRLSPILLCGVLLSAACSQSCQKGGGAATKDDLKLIPKASEILLGFNMERMRSTAVWKKVLDIRDGNAQTKKEYEEFVTKCGLDPFKQIESVTAGFPSADATASKPEVRDYAVVIRGIFDEAKLVACAREQAKKDGSDIVESEYGGKKLYNDPKQGSAFATFLDGKTAIVASNDWMKRAIDLAAGKESAGGAVRDNQPVMELHKRTHTNEAIWGVGQVPQRMRDAAKADPTLAVAGTIKNVFGSIDFAKGLSVNLNVENGTDADAKALAEKIEGQLKELKQNPQVLMLGMGSYLEPVKVVAKGTIFSLGIEFTQQQVDDLVNRVRGMFRGFGAALGGGAAGGGLQGAVPGGLPTDAPGTGAPGSPVGAPASPAPEAAPVPASPTPAPASPGSTK